MVSHTNLINFYCKRKLKDIILQRNGLKYLTSTRFFCYRYFKLVIVSDIHAWNYTDSVMLKCVKASDVLSASVPSGNGAFKWSYTIEGSNQDQGGIAVGPQGEIIIPLKNTNGDGGLVAVKPDGSGIAWKHAIGTDVGGGAAVDDAAAVIV